MLLRITQEGATDKMFLENLLEKKSFFIYENGIIHTRGDSKDSYIPGRRRIALNKGERFLDCKYSEEKKFESLEKCAKEVILPYLQKHPGLRNQMQDEFFSYIPVNHAGFFSKEYVAILKKEKTSEPKVVLQNRTFKLKHHFDTKRAIEMYKEAEKRQVLKQKSSFLVRSSKNQTTIEEQVPGFVMTNSKKDRFYFDNIRLSISLRKDFDKYIIYSPFDANKTHHPFIFDSGHICLSREEFVKDL